MKLIDADALIEKAKSEAEGMTEQYRDFGVLIEWLVDKLPFAQPEPCEYAVSAMAVEEMLKDLLPERGMWEIEGDEAKTAICETVHDALDGLWKLPFVKPDSKELSFTQKALDTISRQAAIDAVNDCGICIQKILDLPSAQPEIIRCRDCKYERDDIFDRGLWCEKHPSFDPPSDDWFCGSAERR